MKTEKVILFVFFWIALFIGVYGFLLPSMVSSNSDSIVVLGFICGGLVYPFLAFMSIKSFYNSLKKKEK